MSSFTKGQKVKFKTTGRNGMQPERDGVVAGHAGVGRTAVNYTDADGNSAQAKPFTLHVRAA